MTETKRQAIFAGLIQNQDEEPVDVTYLGDEAFYVIPDGDFKRHVEAEAVDEEVLRLLGEQMDGMHDQVIDGVLKFLGKEDLFTKTSIDMALKNFDKAFRMADPEQSRNEMLTTAENMAHLWAMQHGFADFVVVHGHPKDFRDLYHPSELTKENQS